MDTRSKNNITSVIYMHYAKNSDLSLESRYIMSQKEIPNCNARLERILLTIPICKLLKLQLMKFRKVQIFNIYNEKSQSDRETCTINRLLIKYTTLHQLINSSSVDISMQIITDGIRKFNKQFDQKILSNG